MMTRVYHYGTVPARIAPVFGEESASFQMRLSNRLWNTLVAIERARTEANRRITFDAIQEEIDRVRERLRLARQTVKDLRRSARSKIVDDAAQKELIQADAARMKDLIQQRKDRSAAIRKDKRDELGALNERTRRRVKRARQAAARMGLFWGSYNDIVQRADMGRKAGELHFRSFVNQGTLTAQIMGGAPPAQCVNGDHTFFQVEDVPGQRWKRARMRIGSNADRSPIWLDIPIILHRDIPAAALIKSVSMTKRDNRWSLSITVSVDAPHSKESGRAVGIDIGYRKIASGIRVAYWADSSGTSGEVVVPDSDMDQFERIRNLRSTCDTMREELLPAICAWLAGRTLSDPWRERTAMLHLWRSGKRICDLIRWWSDNRLDGDAQIFDTAVQWRKQYLHLSNWAVNLEDKLRARIRERYRIFAARIARDCATLCIEDFDLREVAEKPAAESRDRNYAARQRQSVSPSELRSALTNACGREGVRILKLPAEFTTSDCHDCRERCSWDQAAELNHTCEHCGARWDQDYNAARNLLRDGLASAENPPAQDQQVRERKWDRVKRLSQSPSETIACATA
jgi:transposase